VRLNNVFFEFNSDSLTGESKTELDKVVRFLTKNPDTKIKILGHTDDQGTAAYNMNLSVKRAESVYNYLINRQISKDNLTFTGYGESRPIASKNDENDENEDELNRRIEFEISN
jgi:OOP family OmpA-OmpF porin